MRWCPFTTASTGEAVVVQVHAVVWGLMWVAAAVCLAWLAGQLVGWLAGRQLQRNAMQPAQPPARPPACPRLLPLRAVLTASPRRLLACRWSDAFDASWTFTDDDNDWPCAGNTARYVGLTCRAGRIVAM